LGSIIACEGPKKRSAIPTGVENHLKLGSGKKSPPEKGPRRKAEGEHNTEGKSKKGGTPKCQRQLKRGSESGKPGAKFEFARGTTVWAEEREKNPFRIGGCYQGEELKLGGFISICLVGSVGKSNLDPKFP